MRIFNNRSSAAVVSLFFLLGGCSGGMQSLVPTSPKVGQSLPKPAHARLRAFFFHNRNVPVGIGGTRKTLALSVSADGGGCGELYYGTGGSNNPASPNPGDVDLGINTCDSQLGDSSTPSSDIGPGADGYCVAQENFIADLIDAFMERFFPDVASGAATVEDTFVSMDKLTQSFKDHGAELGIISEEAFAQTANSMLLDALAGKPGLQIAQVGEQIYIYNSQSQAIGVYNNLGQTITMFKPTSGSAYFFNQLIQQGGAQITSAGLRGFYSLLSGHIPHAPRGGGLC